MAVKVEYYESHTARLAKDCLGVFTIKTSPEKIPEVSEKLKGKTTSLGEDMDYIKNPEKFEKASIAYEVKADKDGYISKIDSEKCGISSCVLGAGREKKEDEIDYSAGIILLKKTGDKVIKGETIAKLYTNNENAVSKAEGIFKDGITYSSGEPMKQKLIYDSIL